MNDRYISISAGEEFSDKRNFTVDFFGHRIITTVTSTPAVAREWLYGLLRFHRPRRYKLVVGLGVQWRPPYANTAATLQLCIGTRCLIFQLLHADFAPRILERVLADPTITFVGVWNQNDARLLQSSQHQLQVAKLLDLRSIAAASRGLSTTSSMEALADGVLGYPGVHKPNWVGTSDWNAYRLSDAQVQYACVDAFVSFSLGKELEAWNWN
ncbi:unnamed protein product [Linum tenue]|uniref:3'-5' exonuclease domain-containing protein n=1 Tax=Linum tenue TaxID=586396 RepID=A0AAV0QK64_9ROSI|nr:unnamed protein product [Linum tenue]